MTHPNVRPEQEIIADKHRLNGWHPEVQGWSEDILPFYERVAKVLPKDPVCVESGIYRGRSLFFFAEQLLARGDAPTLWAVDPLMWDGGELLQHTLTNWMRFEKNTANVVRLLRTTAKQAARMFDDASLDFCFIDGEHHYENVREDIDAWLPKMKPGSIFSGHDYAGLFGNYPGVAKAVHETFGDRVIQPGPHSAVWMVRL